MRRTLLLSAILGVASTLATANNAHALPGGFTVRAGVDINPLLYAGDLSGTIGDFGWLGIDVAPGYKLLPILTLELDLNPRIPLTGTNNEFLFNIAPGAIFDLYIIYARASLPIEVRHGTFNLQGAAGISFLASGYLGVTLEVNLNNSPNLMFFGAEVGWRL